VNTLALSVVERTRELGLLRAVGMGRGAVRGMIVLESLVISVFGALLGRRGGVVFGWALVRALRSQGSTSSPSRCPRWSSISPWLAWSGSSPPCGRPATPPGSTSCRP
jgi:ABC-type antimicrobial peptide transport system permease subunit